MWFRAVSQSNRREAVLQTAMSSGMRCGPSWCREPTTGNGRSCPVGSAATSSQGEGARSAMRHSWNDYVSSGWGIIMGAGNIGGGGPAVTKLARVRNHAFHGGSLKKYNERKCLAFTHVQHVHF